MTSRGMRASVAELERLRAKRTGYPTTPRGWIWLVATLPFIALIKVLGLIDINVMAYPDHFGHQAIDVEYYLRTNAGRLFKPIYLCSGHIPNAFLLRKHAEHAAILPLPSRLMRYVRIAEKQCIRVWGRSLFRSFSLDHVLQDGPTWTDLPTTLAFSDEENQRGKALLDRLGLVPQGYVCFHCRQAAYALRQNFAMYDKRGARSDTVGLFEESWFQQFRNSDFASYGPAIDALHRYDLKAVRIGAMVEGEVAGMPNLVDFAGKHRAALGEDAAFADAWLMANARFYVGTSSGVTAFAYVFNVPIIWLNGFPWPWGDAPARRGSLYLPKLVTVGGRPLKFTELIEFSRANDWRVLYDNAVVERLGWQVLDNSPEEIAVVVEEMAQRLSGHAAPDRDDDFLQDKLLSCFHPCMPMHGTYARMGRAFLAQHRSLLELSEPRDAITRA